MEIKLEPLTCQDLSCYKPAELRVSISPPSRAPGHWTDGKAVLCIVHAFFWKGKLKDDREREGEKVTIL